jgi:hypothetical protein
MTRTGLRVERIVQTLANPAGGERVEAPSEGFDRGSFVVISGSVPWSGMKGSTQSVFSHRTMSMNARVRREA